VGKPAGPGINNAAASIFDTWKQTGYSNTNPKQERVPVETLVAAILPPFWAAQIVLS